MRLERERMCRQLRWTSLRLLIIISYQISAIQGVAWEDWWTYDGISGPAFWGLINPEWALCNRGRRQSPIDVRPDGLLFDPGLRPLHIDGSRISGVLENTGHGAVLRLLDSRAIAMLSNHPSGTATVPLNASGGPLQYRYRLTELHFHFGLHDDVGSEHQVAGRAFPAEIQVFGFNSQLYSNFTEASVKPNGLVAISVLLQIGDQSNPELRILTEGLDRTKHRGESVIVERISLKGLLPQTNTYITYDGSRTMPGCQETVTWLLINKPVYITKQQLHSLRRLMQGFPKNPKAPLGNNYRDSQPLYGRPVRTNIEFRKHQGEKHCASMRQRFKYYANTWVKRSADAIP